MTDRGLSTRDVAETSGRTTPDAAGGEAPATDAPVAREGDEDAATATGEPQAERDAGVAATGDDGRQPLLSADQTDRFTSRWHEIQASFVDQPQQAVAGADSLVADLMQRLAASFSDERERLEAQWERGDDVSTEDLRVALTHYRSFFERLLSA